MIVAKATQHKEQGRRVTCKGEGGRTGGSNVYTCTTQEVEDWRIKYMPTCQPSPNWYLGYPIVLMYT